MSVNVLREKVICQRCAKRDGTEIWTGSGADAGLAYAHGCYQHWCRECVLTAQIAHCRACAAQIPALEAALAALIAEERRRDDRRPVERVPKDDGDR